MGERCAGLLMPAMPGRVFLERLQALPLTHPPCLFVLGGQIPEDGAALDRPPVEGVLLKPFVIEHLRQLVFDALAKRFAGQYKERGRPPWPAPLDI